MPLPLRWHYKLDRWRAAFAGQFQTERAGPRPRMCPACNLLVGATATKCPQCGASMTFSFAAASRSLGGLRPQTSPLTYGIMGLCCLLYVVSLLATINRSGFSAPGGGLGILFALGGIDGEILVRMGASLPLTFVVSEPWRLVMAVFLHGSLLHLGFNMWVLMDLGPTIEELFGSARTLFIFIVTGVSGYILSSATGHFSVGASGSILGLVGVLLALTTGRHSSSMRMLRRQLIQWLIYIAVLGILIRGVDNFAHFGGFAAGFVLGKLMVDRPPADMDEQRRARTLGWTAGFAVVASFGFMLKNYF